MKTYDFEQYSPQWWTARLGIPTASAFSQIMTPKFAPRDGQMPETYMYEKLAEKVMGFAQDQGGSFASNQGAILEGEAMPFLAFTQGLDLRKVGFCTTDDGRVGCSPDFLAGEDGGGEIKCPQPTAHIRYLLENKVPEQYLAQVHGSLYVTGKKFWVFMSYSRNFPALIVRVERDEKIMQAIQGALHGWLTKFDAALSQITAMKETETDNRPMRPILNDR